MKLGFAAGQDFYWKDYVRGEVPSDAIEGAEGKYVGKVAYNGYNLPASICTKTRTATVEMGGKRILKENIQILCSSNPKRFSWETVNFTSAKNSDVENAFVGGNQDGYHLYIGKAYNEGEWKIGKVVPKENTTQKGLQIWDRSGVCLVIMEFYILKYQLEDNIPQEVSYYWKDYIRGEVPTDAIEGADGKYIGQVEIDSFILPATIYPQSQRAVAQLDRKRVITENIKIFCSKNPEGFYWETINFDSLTESDMRHAVKGGEEGYDLYVGRTFHDGEWKIGKVVPREISRDKGLQVWDRYGTPLVITQFAILKYRSVLEKEEFYWRDYVRGAMPYDVVEGVDGRYIGQVKIDGCKLPATLYPESNRAVTEMLGRRTIIQNIKILCSKNPKGFYWETIDFETATDKDMEHAVKGGDQAYNLYIGRAFRDGEWKIGKVIPKEIAASKGLQVWDANNKCLRITQFLILKFRAGCFPKEDCRAAQNFYWRDFVPGFMPCDALYRLDGRYIGQVVFDNDSLPVAIYPDKEKAVAELNGRTVFRKNVKILCSINPQRLYWDHVVSCASARYHLRNAVKGGHQADDTDLFIGRVYCEGEWKIGKVIPVNDKLELHLWTARGGLVHVTEFDILKCI